MARPNFVPDHYMDKPPFTEVDSTQIHVDDDSALFAWGPGQPDAIPEPVDLPPDMPEIVTGKLDDPKEITDALAKVFEALSMRGKIMGRATLDRMTPDNVFRARNPGSQADIVVDGMDGKLIGLMRKAGLIKIDKPADQMTPAEKQIDAEGRHTMDILAGTAEQFANGESPAAIAASRDRMAQLLLHDFSTGAVQYAVIDGEHVPVKVDHRYRKRILKDPEQVMAVIRNIRQRTR